VFYLIAPNGVELAPDSGDDVVVSKIGYLSMLLVEVKGIPHFG